VAAKELPKAEDIKLTVEMDAEMLAFVVIAVHLLRHAPEIDPDQRENEKEKVAIQAFVERVDAFRKTLGGVVEKVSEDSPEMTVHGALGALTTYKFCHTAIAVWMMYSAYQDVQDVQAAGVMHNLFESMSEESGIEALMAQTEGEIKH
jgi:hypothetical protein